MTNFEFKLIDALFGEGFDNSQVFFVEDINSTKTYFGSNEDIELKGKYVAVYIDRTDIYPWLDKFEPNIVLKNITEKEDIYLYKLVDSKE